MADFCKQCSIEYFGEDSGDLANLGPAENLKPGEGWLCLCEGCGDVGGIVVAQDGTCIAEWCLKHGNGDQHA